MFPIFSLTTSTFIVLLSTSRNNLNKEVKKALTKKEFELNLEFEKISKLKTETELGKQARIIAHDIRSPLETLNNLNIQSIDKHESIILKKSIKRINDIANDLLGEYYLQSTPDLHKADINQLISDMVDFKTIEYHDIVFETKLESNFALDIDSQNDFSRIISNLVNNAYESYLHRSIPKQIEINTFSSENTFFIKIKDFGCGMNPTKLEEIKNKTITTTKAKGNGIGLLSTIDKIEKIKGKIKIDSIINEGTIITISFTSNDKTILIENDELTILNWKHKALKAQKDFFIFKDKLSLYESIDTLNKNTIFYIDSELGHESGETIAKELYELGYTELYMATGHPPEKFSHLKFLKGVIGKKPPF